MGPQTFPQPQPNPDTPRTHTNHRKTHRMPNKTRKTSHQNLQKHNLSKPLEMHDQNNR